MTRFLAPLSLALVLTPPTLAADPLTLLDVFEVETASDPQISPDGSQIVYVRRFADLQSDSFYSNLWIVDSDGSSHRPLTSGKLNRFAPRWSPSGDRIAFISTEEGASSQIWVRYTDTGQMAKLTHHEHAPGAPAWSPDGRHLAFTALVPTAPPAIGDLPSAPEGAEWAEPAKVIDRQFYRFDPIGYLPRGDWHLFTVPSGGGTAHQVTHGSGSWGGPSLGGGGSPVWTPDGTHLLMSANLRPEADNEPLDSEIYEIDLATGAARALTDRHGPDSSVAISPDGSKIAYTGFDDRYQGYQLTYLYLADRDGGNGRVLTSALDRSVGSPHFSADGSRIWITYSSEGRNRLASVDLEGQVTDHADDIGGGVSSYAGGSGYSIAADGTTFAAVLSSPSSPGDVAIGSPGGTPQTLTSINADLLDHRAPVEMEELWFESSHDGRRIQGWILKPPGFDPSRKYPLILEIHGGPFAAYGPRWDMEKQLMAASGYVVLYTNPRGSTSYGEEVGNLIHHDYPGDDFFDLMSGVDAVIDKGYIDSERLFVTGGSGGGVLTSWVIGRTNRFRAAVTVYPVINWYSWVLSADITAFGYRYWFPGLPWDYAEHYQSRSLLSVVKNVKTPTMVLTGEADYRTPMSESEQYYGALKLLGVEAVLVRFPEESHGIRRRPSHWMHKIGYIVGWMDGHDAARDSAAATAGSR
jgi:acylaminoacyl-peptidase